MRETDLLILRVKIGIEARISRMFRRYRALFLLAVIFWQTLAILGLLSVAQHAQENAVQSTSQLHAFYQHYVDQTIHKNGEEDAASHTHIGSFSDAAAILGSKPLNLSVKIPSFAFGELAIALQTPILAGLLRPPQSLR